MLHSYFRKVWHLDPFKFHKHNDFHMTVLTITLKKTIMNQRVKGCNIHESCIFMVKAYLYYNLLKIIVMQ